MVKIRSSDRQSFPKAVHWIEKAFPGVMADAAVWNAFKKHSGMSEFTARDSVRGGIKSPRLVISRMSSANGRFRRDWPDDIELAHAVVDHLENNPESGKDQMLVAATLLSQIVAWRRAREIGIDQAAAAQAFLAEAYDSGPGRYWEQRPGEVRWPANAEIFDLGLEDIGDLTRITFAEAGTESREGRAGVILVVMNRVAAPQFPETIREVIDQRNQFEPISRVGSVAHLPTPSRRNRLKVESIIEDIASGHLTDVTNGATFFQNVKITRRRGTDFSNGNEPTAVIDNHSFYNRYWNYPPVVVPPWRITTPNSRAMSQR